MSLLLSKTDLSTIMCLRSMMEAGLCRTSPSCRYVASGNQTLEDRPHIYLMMAHGCRHIEIMVGGVLWGFIWPDGTITLQNISIEEKYNADGELVSVSTFDDSLSNTGGSLGAMVAAYYARDV